ncbi:MAG: hypothetical protein LBC82_05490 [Oscillospiraceae bacterium]|jgi:hypothetical protein|nr:hypothetical protein [Oscillospiraceae bacterium]
MSKTLEQKLLDKEEQIKKHKKELKQLLQQQKEEKEKAKIRRQTNRGELLEKLMPHFAKLTDSEFKIQLNNLLSREIKTAIPQSSIIEKEDVENDEE